jgi:hypothetical protein
MIDIAILTACFFLSFFVATLVIRLGVPALRKRKQPEAPLPDDLATGRILDFTSSGFWVGFLETFLVFVFVYEREYSALAIIFAAKQFVRKADIEREPHYYLLGTLVNLATAMLFALVARRLVAVGG